MTRFGILMIALTVLHFSALAADTKTKWGYEGADGPCALG